jgi:hypothetical protein
MLKVSLILGACAIAVGAYCMGQQAGVQRSVAPVKQSGLIVSEKDGERREFRTRPGTFFTLYSAPGCEEYLRAVSVIAGQPVAPLSKGEQDEIRKKHVHDGIYPP